MLDKGLAKASCDHVIKTLRHSLNLAVDWTELQTNPASRIPLFNEDNGVENFLDDEQVGSLMRILKSDHNRPVCSILTFLLTTGARLSTALNARWEHIDLEHRVWRIPAAGNKAKRTQSVPLNDAAVAVLKANQDNGSEFCFPNPKTGKPYVTITKVWYRVRKEAGLSNFRIHDLRHSYASFLANSGR
ncbi:MAG: site-specific integrase, partial [Nitrosomonadaceae bacterium]